MFELMKKNEIDCIIVKDFSRFSRNYIDIGKYLEQIFPFMNIRFISINDNYDSNNYLNKSFDMDIQFKGLIYDFYSRDLSDKIISGLSQSAKKGNFIGSYAPYGYKKGENNNLVIDEYSSKVVKKIFNMALCSFSNKSIAEFLNKEKVLTPLEYMRQNYNSNFGNSVSKNFLWNDKMISHILNNEEYTGKTISGKIKFSNKVSKKRKSLSKDKWLIINNTHKPIISQDIFLNVKKNKSNKTNKEIKNKITNNIFKGKIKCGICNHALSFYNYANKYYKCNYCSYNINNKYNIVKFNLNMLLEIIENIFKVYTSLNINFITKKIIQKNEDINREIKKIELKIKKMNIQKLEYYYYYKENKFTKDEFINNNNYINYLIENKNIELKSKLDAKTHLLNINNIFQNTSIRTIEKIYTLDFYKIEIKYNYKDIFAFI